MTVEAVQARAATPKQISLKDWKNVFHECAKTLKVKEGSYWWSHIRLKEEEANFPSSESTPWDHWVKMLKMPVVGVCAIVECCRKPGPTVTGNFCCGVCIPTKKVGSRGCQPQRPAMRDPPGPPQPHPEPSGWCQPCSVIRGACSVTGCSSPTEWGEELRRVKSERRVVGLIT